MRIVIALGGNALLRRGEPMTAENQRQNVRIACEQIAKIWPNNELVIAHGNGPQVGLLALQGAAYTDVPTYPLDVLGAETAGMIGYMIQQELGNLVPFEVPFATLLSQVEVDINDPAFKNPTKPIGPVYTKEEAERLAKEKIGLSHKMVINIVALCQAHYQNVFLKFVRSNGCLKRQYRNLCGGGGIPTYYDEHHNLQGVEAVIDKDLCSALLAENLDADLFIIATDVSATFVDWGKPNQKAISVASPEAISELGFASGSMGPKVQAAINFAKQTGKDAVIGSLSDIVDIVKGKAGTRITKKAEGISYYA